MERKGDGNNSCNLCTWNDTQKLEKGAEKYENRRKTRDHLNRQNTKSPEDLKRLTLRQVPVKYHQLVLARKNRQE